MPSLPNRIVSTGHDISVVSHGTACRLSLYSFNSRSKAYFASLTVRLRLTVKRDAFRQVLNQQVPVSVPQRLAAGECTPRFVAGVASIQDVLTSGESSYGSFPPATRPTRVMPTAVYRLILLIATCAAFCFNQSNTTAADDWIVDPPSILLQSNFETAQVLITRPNAIQSSDLTRANDLTSQALFVSSNPAICKVDVSGRVTAVTNGDAELQVTIEGTTRAVPIHVQGNLPVPQLDFVNDIQPVLYRAGCNSGSCHASQYGKGGFTLSVMGFDPMMDYNAMTVQSRGRRISLASAEDSLILKKAAMAIAHGGGERLPLGSNEFEMIKAWISSGAVKPDLQAPSVTKITITPAQRVIAVGELQQFRVSAEYSNGRVRDVTSLVRFDSMDESVLSVNRQGLAKATGKGQGALMVRFAGHAQVATLVVPFSDQANLANWQSQNYVDEHAAVKFRELGLSPSGLCDDATFLRRVYLDAIGTLPSLDEAKVFLESTEPDKRHKLIDTLLGFSSDPAAAKHTDAYAAFWSLKWADLIRNNSTVVGESGMWAMHNWLRDSFRTNKPVDQFVQELVTAKGSIFSNGPANYFRIASNPPDLAESTAQLFMGTRLQCAKCHHHPYERYSQSDYYGFAAFFARVGNKGSSEFGVFGGETVVTVNSGGEVTHPKTGAVMKPTPLFAEPVDDPQDRRVALSKWLTSTDNELFARNIVNRYVGYLLGRGLVDPIDDLRSTNPPSNVALMEALVADLRANKFDVKQLMRSIMNSRLYQLDSQPTVENVTDERFYSHYKVKRLGAEALLDGIDFATGVMTKHPSLPLGTRAIELPDANTANPFLMVFGKPKRASVCECERTPDENLSQALHTLNGDILATKLADANGRVAKLVAATVSDDAKIHELYMSTLSRQALPNELEAAKSLVASSPSPTEAYQDLLWALINSKQFLFVH